MNKRRGAQTRKYEPRNHYSSSKARPDIAIHGASDCGIEHDNLLAHPWCPEVIFAAGMNNGAVKIKREDKKTEKYKADTQNWKLLI
jgi:hypothetical protein